MAKILIGRGDTDLDYPICRPSLDLDFTQEVLDPRITFSRGSIGTRVNRNRLIETVSANQPRFDYDPVTGECKGLLIEESRTNYNTNSIGSNFLSSPPKLFQNLGFGTFTMPAQTNYSLWSRSNLDQYGALWNVTFYLYKIPGNNVVSFNFFASVYSGTVNTSATLDGITLTCSGESNVSASITLIGDNLYKLNARAKNNSVGSTPLARLNAVGNFTGIEKCYVSHIQAEQGAFPTSYIPTSGSTVTRTADLASITGTNFSSFFNQNEGTFYTSTYKQVAPASPGLRVLEISDGTNNNRTEIGYWFSGGTAGPYIYSAYSGPAQYQTYPTTTFPTSTKQAFSYSQLVNNLTYITSLSSSVSRYNKFLKPTYTSLGIGRGIVSQNQFGGTISRLTYYPRALKPNQLQYLTQ